ncbi:MAG: hypothetical protein KKI09_15140 [Spirochaetes bacterium]|nr:hypothetical protein [Spirochaetota bacterium]MBU0956760.1 hypothetical protein [Spirochaetota bacterium]
MSLFGFRTDDLVSRKKKAKDEAALLKNLREKTKPEKGDLLALIIAALVTLLPVVLGILLLYYVISMLLFG